MGFLKHADKDRVGFPFLAMQAYGKDDFVGWRKLKRVFIDGLQTGGRLCFQLRRWERVTQLKPLLFLGSAGIVGFWGAYESFQSDFGSVIKPALPDASEDCMFVHALMRRCFRRWQRRLQLELARYHTLCCCTLLLLSICQIRFRSGYRESHFPLSFLRGQLWWRDISFHHLLRNR